MHIYHILHFSVNLFLLAELSLIGYSSSQKYHVAPLFISLTISLETLNILAISTKVFSLSYLIELIIALTFSLPITDFTVKFPPFVRLYPIRDNSANKNKLTENEVYDIYAKLKNKMSLTDIAKEYNVSITNISNINQGIIYRFLEDDSYPIYVPINSKPRVSIEKIKKVVELLKHNPDYTYSKIGNIVGIGRKTVSGINNGKLYTDLVEELGINEFPIR